MNKLFFKNICLFTDVVSSKTPFTQKLSQLSHVRIQFYRSFHKGRGYRNSERNPLDNIVDSIKPINRKTLVKPLLFTLGVSTASIVGCIIWEYENLRAHTYSLLRKPSAWVSAHQKKVLAQFKKTESGPIKSWWNSLKSHEKIFYPILAANLLVFGAWRIKALQPVMVKYFCSNPASSTLCLPMVLSTFSHYSFFHLAANMYVLHSFMPGAVSALGKEQFLAMYLSAGVISSFASFLYKVVVNQPGLSLGASGAIMAILSYVCVQYPDTQLSIIFLPMFTFSAGSAIKVIMGIDLAGIVLGWKFFDHAAHLGGALFGIAWCYWGNTHIWHNRDKVVHYYHSFRKSDSER